MYCSASATLWMRSSCFTTVMSCHIRGKQNRLGQGAGQFKEFHAHFCGVPAGCQSRAALERRLPKSGGFVVEIGPLAEPSVGLAPVLGDNRLPRLGLLGI